MVAVGADQHAGELLDGLYVDSHGGLGLEAQALQVVQSRLYGRGERVFQG